MDTTLTTMQLTNVKFSSARWMGGVPMELNSKCEMHLCEINEADLSAFDGEILFSNSRTKMFK